MMKEQSHPTPLNQKDFAFTKEKRQSTAQARKNVTAETLSLRIDGEDSVVINVKDKKNWKGNCKVDVDAQLIELYKNNNILVGVYLVPHWEENKGKLSDIVKIKIAERQNFKMSVSTKNYDSDDEAISISYKYQPSLLSNFLNLIKWFGLLFTIVPFLNQPVAQSISPLFENSLKLLKYTAPIIALMLIILIILPVIIVSRIPIGTAATLINSDFQDLLLSRLSTQNDSGVLDRNVFSSDSSPDMNQANNPVFGQIRKNNIVAKNNIRKTGISSGTLAKASQLISYKESFYSSSGNHNAFMTLQKLTYEINSNSMQTKYNSKLSQRYPAAGLTTTKFCGRP